jgi:hypothetical protein
MGPRNCIGWRGCREDRALDRSDYDQPPVLCPVRRSRQRRDATGGRCAARTVRGLDRLSSTLSRRRGSHLPPWPIASTVPRRVGDITRYTIIPYVKAKPAGAAPVVSDRHTIEGHCVSFHDAGGDFRARNVGARVSARSTDMAQPRYCARSSSIVRAVWPAAIVSTRCTPPSSVAL